MEFLAIYDIYSIQCEKFVALQIKKYDLHEGILILWKIFKKKFGRYLTSYAGMIAFDPPLAQKTPPNQELLTLHMSASC